MTDDNKELARGLRAQVMYENDDMDTFITAGFVRRLADRIEDLNAEIERLREALIGIRAEIDDMDNPFNGGGAPEMAHGFETAVEHAVNIVTAALEGGE